MPNVTSPQIWGLKRGRGGKGGGGGGLMGQKNCAYLWKNPVYALGMGRPSRDPWAPSLACYTQDSVFRIFLFQNEWLKAAFFFSKTFKTRQGFLAISHRFFIFINQVKQQKLLQRLIKEGFFDLWKIFRWLNKSAIYRNVSCESSTTQELRKWNQMKNDPRSCEHNLCNCVRKLKKNLGLQLIWTRDLAITVRCSNQLS